MKKKPRDKKKTRDTIFDLLFAINFTLLVALAGYVFLGQRALPAVPAAPSTPPLAATAATPAPVLPRAPVDIATEGHPSRGPLNAPVTLVEFSDFECPFCTRLTPTLDQLEANYGDNVRRVFRQFPLNALHPLAQQSAEASLCAYEQDSFWEMHDLLFEQPQALDVASLRAKARQLGLEMTAFDDCLDSGSNKARILADLGDGSRAGVTGTPAVFINGRLVSGAKPYSDFSQVIDDELRKAGVASN